MRKKAIVYGAGRCCWDMIVNHETNMPYNIQCIVDKDENKWNTTLCDYVIKSPQRLYEKGYDIVIIAVEKWRNIANMLISDYGIELQNICVYSFKWQQKFVSISEADIIEVERQIYRKEAEIGVMNELLLEACKSGEFIGYDRVCVIDSDEKNIDIVKSFFEVCMSNIEVICEEEADFSKKNTKILFTGSNYNEKRKMFVKQGFIDERNWCIIPLFDAKEMIYI